MSAAEKAPAPWSYPVRVDASLDESLSRWLWLVKWLLLIPHYIVLTVLWLAFVVLSAGAFFAILITGTYPRPIFDFNVGVLRWTWRVQYYAFGAFATDRYPPFSLADEPAYPARLEIAYPERLSRGLVLVKWWLLALPQYLIVGLFTGGGLWVAWRSGGSDGNWNWPGLIGILAVVAGVVLLVTGRYPRQLFDFLLGLNRWVLRVAAYAGLMTDEYPPFRLDMGGHEPGGALVMPGLASGYAGHDQPGQQGWLQGQEAEPPGAQAGPPGPQAGPPGPPSAGTPGWTPGRIVSLAVGAVLVLCSLGLLGGSGVAWWADTAARHGGYVDLGTRTYHAAGYAVATDNIELNVAGSGWDAARSLVGTVRVSVQSVAGQKDAFVGIAPAARAQGYLRGVAYSTVHSVAGQADRYRVHPGSAPRTRPASAGIWAAQASGTGVQTLTWQPGNGTWTVVGMNADASRPVSLRVSVAATLPALAWIAPLALAGGVVLLAAGVLLIVVPLRRASGQ